MPGPVAKAYNCRTSPLERFDLNEILRLIHAECFFVPPAPRQTS